MFVYRDESGEGNIDILDCGTIYILYVNSGCIMLKKESLYRSSALCLLLMDV